MRSYLFKPALVEVKSEVDEKIPFSNTYPPELNEMMLSYMSPFDLEAAIAVKTELFEAQYYFQKPSIKLLKESWEAIINNLIKTLKLIGLSSSEVVDVKHKADKSFYNDLCGQYFQDLLVKIESFNAAKLDVIKSNESLLRDCIMHCVYSLSLNLQEIEVGKELNSSAKEIYERTVRKILLKCIPYAKDNNLLDYWISGGLIIKKFFANNKINTSFELLQDEVLDLGQDFLHLSIAHDVPAFTLGKLIDSGLRSNYYIHPDEYNKHSMLRSALSGAQKIVNLVSRDNVKMETIIEMNEEKYSSYNNIYFTPLLFGLMGNRSDAMLSIMIEKFPNQVGLVLDVIAKSQSLSGINMTIKCNDDKVLIRITPDFAQKIKIKLLFLLDKCSNKSDISLSSKDKADILAILKEDIAKTTNADECIQLYNKHIDACYIKNQASPLTTSFLCAITGSSIRYTNTKILFINLIREKLYGIAISPNYFTAFNKASLYLDSCKKMLNHAIFSDMHDTYGVSVDYKFKLIKRIDDVEKTLHLDVITTTHSSK